MKDFKKINKKLIEISEISGFKLEYIYRNIEEINRKYNLNLSANEKKEIRNINNININKSKKAFDINDGMKPD